MSAALRIRVPLKKVRLKAKAPEYAHEGDAGVDLSYCGEERVLLSPGQRRWFPTGIALELPSGYEGQVRPRSGLALDKGLTVLNAPGTVDSGYRGEVSVILVNLSDQMQEVVPGERIAQLVVAACVAVEFDVVETLGDSKRGDRGFGSTGSS